MIQQLSTQDATTSALLPPSLYATHLESTSRIYMGKGAQQAHGSRRLLCGDYLFETRRVRGLFLRCPAYLALRRLQSGLRCRLLFLARGARVCVCKRTAAFRLRCIRMLVCLNATCFWRCSSRGACHRDSHATHDRQTFSPVSQSGKHGTLTSLPWQHATMNNLVCMRIWWCQTCRHVA